MTRDGAANASAIVAASAVADISSGLSMVMDRSSLAQGGYPRWKDERRPAYVDEMVIQLELR